MRVAVRSFLFLTVFVLLACSENILESFADKDTDRAKYIQAQHLMNSADYDGAVSVLLSTSTAFQERREVRALLASAYAGRGGLEFLSLIERLDNIDISDNIKLFPFLTQSFLGGSSANITDLALAEETVQQISTNPAARTEDENILMALIQLAKIGNVLSVYMDSDNDGSLDGTFSNACTDADTPGTAINDLNVGEIGVSLLGFLSILPHLSDNFTSGVTGDLDDCEADLESLEPFPGVFPLDGVCSISDPSDYTSLHIAGFRSLIKEDALVGFGVNCTGDISACHCP